MEYGSFGLKDGLPRVFGMLAHFSTQLFIPKPLIIQEED